MAWVEARTLRSGKTRYRVCWRDPAGKTHGKVFARKRDAEAFGRVMERWKAEGTYFDPARGRVTLAEFVESEGPGRGRPVAQDPRQLRRRVEEGHQAAVGGPAPERHRTPHRSFGSESFRLDIAAIRHPVCDRPRTESTF